MDELYRTGMLALLIALLLAAQPAISVNETQNVTASVTVNEYISVTLSNVPIEFGSVNPGSTQQADDGAANDWNGDSLINGFPLQITVDSITNVNTNISLNGSDFTGPATFGVGNLSFANDTTSYTTAMQKTFSSGNPPYADWVNIPAPGGGAAQTRNAYFWITIPPGQTAGSYQSSVYVKVETA